MRELVEAAVQAAARAGVVAIIIGGESVAVKEVIQETTVEAERVTCDPELEAVLARNKTLEGRLVQVDTELAARKQQIDATNKRLEEVQAQLSQPQTTATGAGVPATSAQATALQAQIDRANRQLKTQDGEIDSLRKELAAQPVQQTTGSVAQPENVTSLADASIEVLNLESKVLKKCQKEGVDTVEKVKEALLSGRFARKGKGEFNYAKDTIIDIGQSLLSQASGPAQASAVAGPSDATVPPGHVDMTWGARLQACLAKFEEQKGVETYIAGLEVQLEVQLASANGADTTEVQKKIKEANHVKNLYFGQQLAFVYTLNLDPKTKGIEAALKAAGLEDLWKQHEARMMQAQLVGAGASQ